MEVNMPNIYFKHIKNLWLGNLDFKMHKSTERSFEYYGATFRHIFVMKILFTKDKRVIRVTCTFVTFEAVERNKMGNIFR